MSIENPVLRDKQIWIELFALYNKDLNRICYWMHYATIWIMDNVVSMLKLFLLNALG